MWEGAIMVRTRALGTVGIVLASLVLMGPATLPAEKSASVAAAAHRAALDPQMVWQTTKIYCDSCHTGPKARGKLNLETLDLTHLDANGETWEKLINKLRSRAM